MTDNRVVDVNICCHLVTAARQNPSQLAVAVQKAKGLLPKRKKLTYQEITFSELDTASDQLAFTLNEYGIVRGMKAVLMVPPSIEFFSLTFALFKAGIIPVIVDPGMGFKNLGRCFKETRPDAFIGVGKAHFARQLLSWGKDSITKVISVNSTKSWGGASIESLVANMSDKGVYPMTMLEPDEMCAILYTSGSTGQPKGVIYSHKMFNAQIDSLKNDYHIENGERDLATFPLFSLFGPALGMASIIPAMNASRPISANPRHIFSAIKQYQCTNMFANPALIDRLTRSPSGKLSSLKRVISAGAPATIIAIKRFSKRLENGEIISSYGATEALPISKIGHEALCETSDITDSGGGVCVGRPIEGVEITIIKITEKKIAGWQDSLSIADGEIGEIVVKGPMVSRGYYNNDRATIAAKIEGEDGSLYHRMGDVGYFDSEGMLWMCGRKSHRVDTLTDSGEIRRYYPLSCERIYDTHSQVKRSALVGVNIKGKSQPLVCIELLYGSRSGNHGEIYAQLTALAEKYPHLKGITRFLVHPGFPIDVRHNAKIYREKLAVWAQNTHRDCQHD